MSHQRVLIMGGTGVFGKRLARHLATFADVELFVSSRTESKAVRFVEELAAAHPNLKARGIALDHRKTLRAQLEAIKPFAVVDCSGPFQSADYKAAEMILKAGAHLIDLADARDYLEGFSRNLNELAQKNGVSALTGASSTPSLSGCVVAQLTQGWQRVDSIDICITPGGKSEVGRSVIEAILSYAGHKIPIWNNGELAQTYGWVGARRVSIPKLGVRRVAPVETFDAEHLGPLYDVRSRVSFAAGLESQIEQRGIETMAFLRKHRLFPNPKALIVPLLNARRVTRIPTSDQGGMLVEIVGLNEAGRYASATWSLLAKEDHGPFIPILPAAAALQKLMKGQVPSGAGLAGAHLCLADILAQMKGYAISSETDYAQSETSVFEAKLGTDKFRTLPKGLQDFHRQDAPPVWAGKAKVARGKNPVTKAIAAMFGFPKSGEDVAVTVCIDRTLSKLGKPQERWTRTFGTTSMSSELRCTAEGVLSETFAPFSFVLDVSADASEIVMPVAAWRLGFLPLPRALAPRSQTREYQDADGRFRFDVRLSLPIFGLLAHYQGWLKPAGAEEGSGLDG